MQKPPWLTRLLLCQRACSARRRSRRLEINSLFQHHLVFRERLTQHVRGQSHRSRGLENLQANLPEDGGSLRGRRPPRPPHSIHFNLRYFQALHCEGFLLPPPCFPISIPPLKKQQKFQAERKAGRSAFTGQAGSFPPCFGAPAEGNRKSPQFSSTPLLGSCCQPWCRPQGNAGAQGLVPVAQFRNMHSRGWICKPGC